VHAAIKNVKEKVEQFESLLRELPLANRVLLSWMIVHMTHVIAKVYLSHCTCFGKVLPGFAVQLQHCAISPAILSDIIVQLLLCQKV